jgi:hypothetical protein
MNVVLAAARKERMTKGGSLLQKLELNSNSSYNQGSLMSPDGRSQFD